MIIAHEVGYNHHHVGWVGGGLGGEGEREKN